MNREIKFRAWLPISKAMTTMFGFTLNLEGKINTQNGAILMQYTGLKDKNGKEIYEGDIVKAGAKHGFNSELLNEFKEINKLDSMNGIGLHFIGIIRIDLFRGLMFENPSNGYSEPMFSRHFKLLRNHSEIEVIGNIYENPELLK